MEEFMATDSVIKILFNKMYKIEVARCHCGPGQVRELTLSGENC